MEIDGKQYSRRRELRNSLNVVSGCYIRTDNIDGKTVQTTCYIYFPAEKKAAPIILEPGKDGITEAIILQMDDLDHDEELIQRYEDENHAFCIDSMKKAGTEGVGEEGKTFRDDPIDQIPTRKGNPLDALMAEEVTEDPLLLKVEELLHQLPEDKMNLVYDHFGAMRKIAVIAAEENARLGVNKSRQAYSKSFNGILKKVKKMLAKAGLTGWND